MVEKVRLLFDKTKFILFLLIWACLYFIPWAKWLTKLPWAQVGIGLVVFALPGIATSLYLAGKRFTLIGHLVSGLAISIFFVGALGFLGRIFHLPFAVIKPIFFVTGLLLFLLIKKFTPADYQWYKPKRLSWATTILFVVIAATSILLTFFYRFQGDDFSYLAYLTNWQHAAPLNFREIIFNTGQADSIRFWLAMLPMNFAFLSELTNVHGVLLMGLYLEPFLVLVATFAAYTLYEDFLQSEYLAIAALLLQFMFLIFRNGAIYTGLIFFNRLVHDKAFAGFILVPIFFLAVRYLIESFNWRSILFTLLIGFSLTLTHPVILAFSIFIAGIYAVINTLPRKDYKKLAVTVCLLAVIILPAASTRFIQLPLLAKYIPALAEIKAKGTFDLESALDTNQIDARISYIPGTPFYGFNLNLIAIKLGNGNLQTGNWLQTFLSWSYVWLLILGFLWSLLNLRKSPVAPFIAASCLLVALAAIPYTGWLIGYFVSARLLLRAMWMMQFGLIGAILLFECYKFALNRMPPHLNDRWKPFIEGAALATSVILSIAAIVGSPYAISVTSNAITKTLNTYNEYQSNTRSLAAFGEYIETNIPDTAVFIAPDGIRDYIPGLSAKSKVIYFRSGQFSVYPIDKSKTDLLLAVNDFTIEERIKTLIEYHVDYIVTKDSSLKNYYINGDPHSFNAQKTNGVWLIKFNKPSP